MWLVDRLLQFGCLFRQILDVFALICMLQSGPSRMGPQLRQQDIFEWRKHTHFTVLYTIAFCSILHFYILDHNIVCLLLFGKIRRLLDQGQFSLYQYNPPFQWTQQSNQGLILSCWSREHKIPLNLQHYQHWYQIFSLNSFQDCDKSQNPFELLI